MNFKKILVAIDFSAHSNSALIHAASLAKVGDAELHVVHVVESLTYRGVPYVEPMKPREQETSQEAAEKALEQAVASLGADAPAAISEILHGDPRRTITKHAEAKGIDLIVIGAAGHGRLHKLLMGSISHHVTQTAECSVMVVRG